MIESMNRERRMRPDRISTLAVLLLVVVAACGKSSDNSSGSSGSAQSKSGSSKAGDFFVDETEARGINFRFQCGMSGKRWMPEQLGGGGAFFDADGDGDLDCLLINGGPLPGADQPAPNAFFLNDGEGRFRAVENAAGLSGGRDYGVGCAVADIDLDGDIDVFITNWGPDRLYLNDGQGKFTDITESSGIKDSDWGASAAFGDVDGDGLADLYVTNYLAYEIAKHKPCYQRTHEIYCGPQPYDGVPDRLYKNRGGGKFEDVTATSFSESTAGKGLALSMLDFDRDGDLDIYVANDQTPNFLWRNDGKGKFENIADLAGVASSKDAAMQAGMGVAWADFGNDLLEDIVVTNFEDQVNSVYRNDGDGFYTEISYQCGIGYESRPMLGWGVAMIDFDQDGWKDLCFVNGHIYDNAQLLNDQSSWAQKKRLHFNRKDGTFAKAEGAGGAAFDKKCVGRGLIYGDIDRDGDVDLLASNIEDSPNLLINHGARGRFLTVAPVHATAKTPLVGTRVTITVGGKKQVASCQTGASYLAAVDPNVHFGIGDATMIDEVEIAWLGGKKETFGPVESNRLLIVSPGRPAEVAELKTGKVQKTLTPR